MDNTGTVFSKTWMYKETPNLSLIPGSSNFVTLISFVKLKSLACSPNNTLWVLICNTEVESLLPLSCSTLSFYSLTERPNQSPETLSCNLAFIIVILAFRKEQTFQSEFPFPHLCLEAGLFLHLYVL